MTHRSSKDLQKIATVGEAYHGGACARELNRHGIHVSEAIDFSSNILAHGPSPQVRLAVHEANLAAYPDRDCVELRQVIASYFQINWASVLVGNGSCELIHLIARTIIQPGDAVLIVGPTFSEYERASSLVSAQIHECRANASDGFAVPINEIESTLSQSPVNLLWLSNPNNPTGRSVCKNQLLHWIRCYRDTTFVIDESYIEFAEEAKSLISDREPNLIVLRSMTKSYGLAGLRLGFVVVQPELYERLCGGRVPWTVNTLAQAAGTAALLDSNYYCNAVTDTLRSKRELLSDLSARGFSPVSSDANFFLLPINLLSSDQHDSEYPSALQVRTALLAQKLVVRDCTSFGLPGYLRIAVLDPENNRRLARSLSRVTNRAEPINDTRITNAANSPLAESVAGGHKGHVWDETFRTQLRDLFKLRRDVRSFKRDAIPAESIQSWIEAACLAPSVGLSQPWKLVSVNDVTRRLRMIHEYESQNELASNEYHSGDAAKYRELKLSGMREAPEHLAVFVDPDPVQGRGLGRKTMPESVSYSVVAAIQNFWLAARSEGVGVGWVSILRPEVVNGILDVPAHWQLIAYLCIGNPQLTDVETPELENLGWERRANLEQQWHHR